MSNTKQADPIGCSFNPTHIVVLETGHLPRESETMKLIGKRLAVSTSYSEKFSAEAAKRLIGNDHEINCWMH